MAYVFSSIDQALQQGQGQGQSNIFGGNGDQSGMSQSGPQSSGPSSSGPASSDSGGSSGGKSSSGSAKQNASRAQSMVQDRAIIDKNQIQAPTITQPIKQQQEATNTKLQDEANSYMQANQNLGRQQNIAERDIDQAVMGLDPAYQSKLAARLSQTNAPQAAAFSHQVNPEIAALQNLKTQGGLQDLFYKQGGQLYNKGQAALDSTILGQNKGFQQERAGLLNQQQALQQRIADENARLQGEAQGQINREYGEGTEAIKGRLGTLSSQIQQAAQAKAAQDNAARMAAQNPAALGEFYRQQENPAIEELKRNYQDIDPELAKYIRAGYMPDVGSAQKFVSLGGAINPEQEYTDTQAQQFNLINSLLGNSNRIQAGTGPSGSPLSFNKQAYQQAVLDIARKNRKDALDAQEAENRKKNAKGQSGVADTGGGGMIDAIGDLGTRTYNSVKPIGQAVGNFSRPKF